MNEVMKVGVLGCGNISGIYLQAGRRFEAIEVVACADLDMARAEARAEEFGVPKACTTEELLADAEVEIVLNLTTPDAHAGVALAALEAGKHVYNEKPLAATRADGRRILDAARAAGLRVGCAPDTFLGGGIQTCRWLIDQGAIGRPVGCTAFMMSRGHETWHPAPEFFYKPGGGPMLDMGPYYLTALVSLIGPVRRVTGATTVSFPERVITSEPKRGQKIRVEVPTYVAGLMDFECGAVGAIITTYDVKAAELPLLQIFGSEGTLMVPNPNTFGGPVRIWRDSEGEWREVELTHGYTDNSRGLGVADMAQAIRSGRPHRASGELAFHVLDVMQAFHEASERGRHVELSSGCGRPAPLPQGFPDGAVDP